MWAETKRRLSTEPMSAQKTVEGRAGPRIHPMRL
jgi:hypothetical protein